MGEAEEEGAGGISTGDGNISIGYGQRMTVDDEWLHTRPRPLHPRAHCTKPASPRKDPRHSIPRRI